MAKSRDSEGCVRALVLYYVIDRKILFAILLF